MKPYNKLWKFDCGSSIISVSGTPNLSCLVAGTIGKFVYLLNGEGIPLWQEPLLVDDEVWATAISDDGQIIAVGTSNKNPLNGTLFIFSREGKHIWSTRVRSPIWNVKLSADGDLLVASTWSNQLLLFKKSGAEYLKVKAVTIPGSAGLYGCDFMENHHRIVVASYDKGLYFINYNGEIISESVLQEGLYNISYAKNSDQLFIGRRDGSFGVVSFSDSLDVTETPSISQRPVCGISATENGTILACGSFDSRVIVANSYGDVLWEYRTKGEVWSTAISASGSKIVAGCGDHILRAFNNVCNVDAYKEIKALEQSVERSNLFADEIAIQNLIELYRKYGTIEYGYTKLKKLFDQKPFLHIYHDKLKSLLSGSLNSSTDYVTHYNLGLVFLEEKSYDEAIKHFQLAALNPAYRSLAQRKASECFWELGLKTASTSADRQSREQHLDYEARHVIFILARSYEDFGQWRKASKLYEMLVAWDVEFRNARDKLKLVKAYNLGSTPDDNMVFRKDFTGYFISLLGPDVPKNVDKKLTNIIEARTKEILIDPSEVSKVRFITGDLLSDKNYSRGIKKDFSLLDYDQQLFLKYDFGLPQDEMKKFLETVNAYEYFSNAARLSDHPLSLDIGSATGRYPSLLKRMGFNAYGIDIEEAAILYATEKKPAEEEWPKYICADALDLDQYLRPGLHFNLVTCMMGTFEHINKSMQEVLVSKLFNRLRPGGVCIISVWDKDCPHLAYLSIYDEGQKELIRENSITQTEMQKMFANAGFSDIKIIPFALLPHTFIYDLGIERFQEEDVEIATQADLAARALFKDRNGEMFLTIGYKI
ncbi:MAG: methyltransferase domain-containing protein [Ferruginibacter sp.]